MGATRGMTASEIDKELLEKDSGDRLDDNQYRGSNRIAKPIQDNSTQNKTVSRDKIPLSRLAERSSSHMTSSSLLNIESLTNANQSVPTKYGFS